MVLKKFIEKRFIKKHIWEDLDQLARKLAKIRTHSNTLSICPKPTGPHWLGIYTATQSLFRENILVLPQYYSRSVYSNSELRQLGEIICEKNFDQVIFSGLPLYFNKIIDSLKLVNPKIVIGAIYMGTFSELSGNNELQSMLLSIINLQRTNKLSKIGFLRKDLSESYQALTGLKSFDILLNTSHLSKAIEKKPFNDGKIHIGVLASNSFNKNRHNQVAASLLIENTVVHVLDRSEFDYLSCYERVVSHDWPDREDFLELLNNMDINIHCSFSESWGQVITESLALGVPCICSSTTEFFRFDEQLRKDLCIDRFDNPMVLKEFIIETLPKCTELSIRGLKYIEQINKLSQDKLSEFLLF